MKDIPNHIRVLIYKDLRGSASIEEQKELDTWFEEQNQASIYINPTNIKAIKAQQRTKLNTILRKKTKSIPLVQLSGIAAVFILFSLATLIYLVEQKPKPIGSIEEAIAYQSFTANYGQRKSILLPDGSTVKLFGPSTLFLHPDYPLVRKTKLSGEGFFDIRPDSLRPFFVETESFHLKVLGTSFLVKSDSSLASSVAIQSGLVNVSRGEDFSENLQKNDFWVIEKASSIPIKSLINPDFFFAKVDNTLWYDKTPLRIVLQDLKNWYGLEELTVQTPIDDYCITGKFKNESLKSIMESISYSTGIAYELTNKKLNIVKK